MLSFEVVVVGFHQPLSVVYSRGRHLVSLAAPRCPDWIQALNEFALAVHQSMGVEDPMDRHLGGFAAPRCPRVEVASWVHQPAGADYPLGRHLERLSATRCPGRPACLAAEWCPGAGWRPVLRCSCYASLVWPGFSGSCAQTLIRELCSVAMNKE